MKSLLFSKKNIDFIGIYLRTLKVSLLQFSIIEKERKASIRHNASNKQRNMQNARTIHWNNILVCLLLNYFSDMFSVV